MNTKLAEDWGPSFVVFRVVIHRHIDIVFRVVIHRHIDMRFQYLQVNGLDS
jgi:hypothetical protein